MVFCRLLIATLSLSINLDYNSTNLCSIAVFRIREEPYSTLPKGVQSLLTEFSRSQSEFSRSQSNSARELLIAKICSAFQTPLIKMIDESREQKPRGKFYHSQISEFRLTSFSTFFESLSRYRSVKDPSITATSLFELNEEKGSLLEATADSNEFASIDENQIKAMPLSPAEFEEQYKRSTNDSLKALSSLNLERQIEMVRLKRICRSIRCKFMQTLTSQLSSSIQSLGPSSTEICINNTSSKPNSENQEICGCFYHKWIRIFQEEKPKHSLDITLSHVSILNILKFRLAKIRSWKQLNSKDRSVLMIQHKLKMDIQTYWKLSNTSHQHIAQRMDAYIKEFLTRVPGFVNTVAKNLEKTEQFIKQSTKSLLLLQRKSKMLSSSFSTIKNEEDEVEIEINELLEDEPEFFGAEEDGGPMDELDHAVMKVGMCAMDGEVKANISMDHVSSLSFDSSKHTGAEMTDVLGELFKLEEDIRRAKNLQTYLLDVKKLFSVENQRHAEYDKEWLSEQFNRLQLNEREMRQCHWISDKKR